MLLWENLLMDHLIRRNRELALNSQQVEFMSGQSDDLIMIKQLLSITSNISKQT